MLTQLSTRCIPLTSTEPNGMTRTLHRACSTKYALCVCVCVRVGRAPALVSLLLRVTGLVINNLRTFRNHGKWMPNCVESRTNTHTTVRPCRRRTAPATRRNYDYFREVRNKCRGTETRNMRLEKSQWRATRGMCVCDSHLICIVCAVHSHSQSSANGPLFPFDGVRYMGIVHNCRCLDFIRGESESERDVEKSAKMLLFRVNYNLSPPTHPVSVALGVHLVCGHVRLVYLYASDRN